ncbi:lipopolysaccharide biosynthesis protein [Sphingobium sp. BYY-5]|uniref:lipopolysaccharide biosynthesis protein n=1 Tax=Sphingobium sp. BYY-5 TaxID=2926400 RepID=UPI001FA791C1|nr:lipopolysaccharide biosynthesis protein [Sphingobium sp. BYY-5]MCI4592661.1 lipopolysaccharide biosynthesis protein [Sphingobium sp. BYY-5]
MSAEQNPAAVEPRFDTKLRRQSKASVGWSVMRFMSDQVFSFLVFVLLARLLAPGDIGAFALMAVFAEVFRAISTAGLIQTVARERILSDEFLDTIYRGNMGFSLIACAITFVLAMPFAAFMDAPQIAWPLCVLSLVLPISALGQTHMALRLRAFGHRTTALRSVLSGVIGGGAAVAAAFAGLGLWALVIQRIVTAMVGAVLGRMSYDWTPGKAFSWAMLKRNLGLNGSLTATQLVFIFTQRLQDLVIGTVIGIAAVGIYRTAWRTVELIANGAIQPFSTVAMQTLARVKDDRAEMLAAYRWMISKASALSFPALVGFGSLAPLAIPVVFGDKWAQSGQLAQIFAFMALPFTLNFFASPALGAAGASRALMFLGGTQLAMTAIFTLVAAPHGLYAIAWAYVLRAYLTLPLQVAMLKRISGIGLTDTMMAVWEPLVASGIMGLFVHFTLAEVTLVTSNRLAQLILVAGSGAFVYGVALLTLSQTWRRLLIGTARRALA